MAVWEIRTGDMDGRPVLVAGDKGDVAKGLFDMEGQPKDWMHRPAVAFFTRSKKKLRGPANVIPFTVGTFVLDAAARAAIGGFLSRFGQLLELERGGEILYAFNCTTMVECIDQETTKRDEFGSVILEAFIESRVPTEACVFKDPSTAALRIYANDEAKQVLEKWSADAGITGLEIVALERI